MTQNTLKQLTKSLATMFQKLSQLSGTHLSRLASIQKQMFNQNKRKQTITQTAPQQKNIKKKKLNVKKKYQKVKQQQCYQKEVQIKLEDQNIEIKKKKKYLKKKTQRVVYSDYDQNGVRKIRKPTNSYMEYLIVRRPQIWKENPNIQFLQLTAIVTKQWKQMPQQQRNIYEKMREQTLKYYNQFKDTLPCEKLQKDKEKINKSKKQNKNNKKLEKQKQKSQTKDDDNIVLDKKDKKVVVIQ